MILLFIITSILYLLLTYLVLSLYYRYRKDIEEIENRCLQLEKRVNEKVSLDYVSTMYNKVMNILVEYENEIKELKARKIFKQLKQSEIEEYKKQQAELEKGVFVWYDLENDKEVETMACGTKGRPRGRRTTSRGGGRKK